MSRSEDSLFELEVQIAEDNRKIRLRFLDAFETLSKADLIAMVGSDPGATSEVERWIGERQVFSVPVEGEDRFPAFQFRDRAPRPVIGQALAILPVERTPWPNALWFVSSNSWIGGPAPITLLDSNPASVREAAAHQSDEISG